MHTPPVALVTGASSGIGRATALALHQAGFRTYATARQPTAVADLQARGLSTLALDVTDDDSMRAAVAAVAHDAGAIDLLVNNAGYGLNGPLEELEPAAVQQLFATNVFGLLRMSQLVVPAMRQRGRGRIIQVGSIGGTFTVPGAGAYHASKYAVEALSDALRYEVQPFGIDVVLIQPTGVRTPFFTKIATSMPDTGAASPYAAFKARMNTVTTAMHTGNGRYGLVTADAVAAVIVRAAQARRPRTRYVVGLSAHFYRGIRRLVSDRTWDRLMALQFPHTPPTALSTMPAASTASRRRGAAGGEHADVS